MIIAHRENFADVIKMSILVRPVIAVPRVETNVSLL